MQYYDLKCNWPKIKPHLANKELNAILVIDFNKYTYGRWRTPFKAGMYPDDFETNDWRCERRGRPPQFWRYVEHAACHWIVNFTLKLAMLAEPQKKWRIITTQKHSTVWDGERTLFDFNFQAMGISPAECFLLTRGHELAPGKACA